MRRLVAVAIMISAACGGQTDDVCRPLGPSSAIAGASGQRLFTVQPRNGPYVARAACECWEGGGWTPRPATGCINAR